MGKVFSYAGLSGSRISYENSLLTTKQLKLPAASCRESSKCKEVIPFYCSSLANPAASCGISARWSIFISNLGNLVHWAWLDSNVFARNHGELFRRTGVVEYWQKLKPEFQIEQVLSLLHYSSTPALQQTAARGERALKPPQGAAQSQGLPCRSLGEARSSGPGFFARLSSLHSSLFPRLGLASFVFLIFVLYSSYAHSAQVTLIWDPVTHPDLAGYKIHYGNSSHNYDDTTDVGNQTSWTITDLIDTEPYYFAVTAYDIYANESDYSNEVSWQISQTGNATAYTPVTPCRIVDTRKAGGAVSAGGIRSYNVWGDVFSQGGNPAGCPSPKGEPRAVHVNVTSVPLGIGYLTAYPYGSTAPLAILVEYKVGVQNVANSGTVKTCFNCAKDINIKSNYATAHVVIDVLGYFYSKP